MLFEVLPGNAAMPAMHRHADRRRQPVAGGDSARPVVVYVNVTIPPLFQAGERGGTQLEKH
jgi:hypothetical protein